MSAGRTWRAWGLVAASVVLPVAVAVASNQILNNGVWNGWWGLVAVALTAASTLVTYRLTSAPLTVVEPANAQGTAAAVDDAAGGSMATETVEGSTAAGDITQIQGVGGGVRIVRGRAPSSPPAAPADPSADVPGGDTAAPPGGGRQVVTGTQAGGSIDQISGVRGDVDIESS